MCLNLLYNLMEGLHYIARLSVADPDPHVFGPPGSGAISQTQRYGSGSGSIYHQAKVVRKTLIPTICDSFNFEK
jgi:hypothetical protein